MSTVENQSKFSKSLELHMNSTSDKLNNPDLQKSNTSLKEGPIP